MRKECWMFSGPESYLSYRLRKFTGLIWWTSEENWMVRRAFTVWKIHRAAKDAVAGSSQEAHEYALKAIRYLQRDALIDTADVEAAD